MKLEKIVIQQPATEKMKTLASLFARRHGDFYPELPVPLEDHYLKAFNASPRPTHRFEYYLIGVEEVYVGFVQVRYNLMTDLHNLGLDYYVLPVDQKSDLLQRAVFEILKDVGEAIKTVSLVWLRNEQTGSELKLLHFFNQIADRLVYTEHINVAEFSSFDTEEVLRTSHDLKERAQAKGYIFRFIENGDFSEDPLLSVSKLAPVVEEIDNDMPTEDADWEEEIVNDEVLQALYRNISERAGTHLSLIAIEESSGEIAGLTDIYYYRYQPNTIMQGDTGVISRYRGNRLGKTLKYIMLNYILTELEDYNPTHWVTGNAGSNEHMLAINRQMNYHHWYSEFYYEVNLETVLYLLENFV